MQSTVDSVDVDHDDALRTRNAILPVKEGGEILQESEIDSEDELSEQQLRELYDREEIDRFLNLFAAVRIGCFNRLYQLIDV